MCRAMTIGLLEISMPSLEMSIKIMAIEILFKVDLIILKVITTQRFELTTT